MNHYTSRVNPFQGCGEIDLPTPEGIAASWHFIKALTGNTHPGAMLPFGKYSCCLYTGGYPTGYGINTINCGGSIQKLHGEMPFIGLSHFQQSGTGAIGVYYNYALTSPGYGAPTFEPRRLLEESAAPGYYAARIPDIRCEATVTEKAVLHRYTFAKPDGCVAINFAHSGIYKKADNDKSCGRVFTAGANELRAEMRLQGVTWYFTAVCEAAKSVTALDAERAEPSHEPMVGCFRVPAGEVIVKLTASTRSMEHAVMLSRGETASFDEARADADAKWNAALSKVEIDTDDDRELEIFYSNFYHTLVKPNDFSGESFFEGWGDGAFMIDLATMWDIYKTQLPLLFTLYPEVSEKILDTLRRFSEVHDSFPHCLMLSSDIKTESNQARMLSEHAIADAYWRGIPADYKKLLTLSKMDASRFMDDLSAPSGCEKAAHTVDITCAHRALAGVARDMGEDASYFDEVASQYVKAYGDDGLMKTDSDYYEGNRYNYSFRPTPEALERIRERGTDYYRAVLRRFFGYTDADDFTSRFEGYNNETDMEAPAFCHYIDRDMYCEILTAGIDYMFTTGRGGIPGNNDSGGLSSCYIWNVLGLFPISGFDRLICGSPRYRRAVMHLPAGDLIIRREGAGIYTKRVTFNGAELAGFELSVRDMMRGGELVFEMSEK